MEVFHEDILETFIFCFIASFGIIQIMAGIRGWHGLSIYGGRVRRNLNNALGAALVILAYAYYFSDPLHRNVRNIEGFMSLVALGLGVIAAAAATILLSAGSESLRRYFRSRKDIRALKAGVSLTTISLESGIAHLTSHWGESGDNLVVLMEAGRGCERLLRRLAAALPGGKGMLSLQLEPDAFNPEGGGEGEGIPALDMLRELEEERQLTGETFMGLGWGADLLMQIRLELEEEFEPKHLLSVAPVVPDYDRGFVGDALLSNPPQDIGEAVYMQRPWRERRSVQLLRLWIPVAITLILLGTLVTFIFDVRWKLLIGFLGGLVLSLWLAYFLAAWRGLIARGGGREERMISLLRRPKPLGGNVSTQVIITWEESASIVSLPDTERQAIDSYHIEVWNEVLRGKFTLVKGTLPRLVNLIWGDGDKDSQGEEPAGAP
jgi:hypothetical protein